MFAFRIGLADVITGLRRGRFWSRGRRWFLDLRRPDRAVVLRLAPGSEFDAIAVEAEQPEALLAAVRGNPPPGGPECSYIPREQRGERRGCR